MVTKPSKNVLVKVLLSKNFQSNFDSTLESTEQKIIDFAKENQLSEKSTYNLVDLVNDLSDVVLKNNERD